MLDKRLEDITIADIRALVENNVLERKTLEYKSELPLKTNDSKRELLKDVSSFVNTLGGDLIYGVRENDGVVSSDVGLVAIDADAEIARLENIIREGISPRIPVEIQTIQCEDGKVVMILRTKASLEAPHRVVFDGHDRFYRRNSNGKYPMDVGELRAAFLQSGEIVERIRRFREARIADIRAGDAPLPIISTDRFITIHIVPLSALNTTQRLDPRVIESISDGMESAFRPFSNINSWSQQINFEGVAVYTPNEKGSWHYTQLYRDGKIEVYDSMKLTKAAGSQEKTIAMFDLESSVLGYVRSMRDMLDKLGFNPPYHVFISLVGVQGLTVYVPSDSPQDPIRIRQRDLLLPEMVLDKSDDEMIKVIAKMKPVFDVVWNAAGMSESPNFKDALAKERQSAG